METDRQFSVFPNIKGSLASLLPISEVTKCLRPSGWGPPHFPTCHLICGLIYFDFFMSIT